MMLHCFHCNPSHICEIMSVVSSCILFHFLILVFCTLFLIVFGSCLEWIIIFCLLSSSVTCYPHQCSFILRTYVCPKMLSTLCFSSSVKFFYFLSSTVLQRSNTAWSLITLLNLNLFRHKNNPLVELILIIILSFVLTSSWSNAAAAPLITPNIICNDCFHFLSVCISLISFVMVWLILPTRDCPCYVMNVCMLE